VICYGSIFIVCVQYLGVWQKSISLQGRGGKGAIYVFAAGNDEEYFDDANSQTQTSSIYTITIGSLSSDGSPAYYTTPGACVLAATYGGDLKDNTIGIVSKFVLIYESNSL